MEQKRKYYYVQGFAFTDEQEAKKAQKESEGIRYIKEQMDKQKPAQVLELYQKILSEELFETPVGIRFLKELQEYLMAVPGMNKEELPPIVIKSRGKEEAPGEEKPKPKEREPRPREQVRLVEKHINYKKRYHFFCFAACVLFAAVVALFGIELTSNNPNILNYENQLIDRYSDWEQQLEEKEQELKQLEQQLSQE